jgi:hypothetical protein
MQFSPSSYLFLSLWSKHAAYQSVLSQPQAMFFPQSEQTISYRKKLRKELYIFIFTFLDWIRKDEISNDRIPIGLKL